MNSSAVIVDATRCPLCGRVNQCALEVERTTGLQQPPCWCTRVDFNRELLESLPAESRGLACICQACAAKPTAAAEGPE
ncbi:cysteine-rich CWC family protein [Caenimonas soli]|jgi:hypothetical protein|uniref:cysteine-rich CWC family protein n=1 Tax=Caenimonas soli TaxID=2735555 RepID=UPI001552B0CE|nr:cysteine-rich CWC family protein [Caenimonas soli]NPC59281.1 cysteine-rich CWC family protein [Caenimonas soli]